MDNKTFVNPPSFTRRSPINRNVHCPLECGWPNELLTYLNLTVCPRHDIDRGCRHGELFAARDLVRFELAVCCWDLHCHYYIHYTHCFCRGSFRIHRYVVCLWPRAKSSNIHSSCYGQLWICGTRRTNRRCGISWSGCCTPTHYTHVWLNPETINCQLGIRIEISSLPHRLVLLFSW